MKLEARIKPKGGGCMQIKPEEITKIIKGQIEKYEAQVELAEIGQVIQVGDGIARVYGQTG